MVTIAMLPRRNQWLARIVTRLWSGRNGSRQIIAHVENIGHQPRGLGERHVAADVVCVSLDLRLCSRYCAGNTRDEMTGLDAVDGRTCQCAVQPNVPARGKRTGREL